MRSARTEGAGGTRTLLPRRAATGVSGAAGRTTRRWFTASAPALATLGLSLAAGACGPSGAAGGVATPVSLGQGDPPVNVVFSRTAEAPLAAAYDAQAEAFNQKQNRIRARYEQPALGQGESWQAKVMAMLAADSAPDCFLVWQDAVAGLGSTGTLLNLDPYMKRDAKALELGDFYAPHLENGKWQGKQMALTPDGCALLEFYNATAFAEAGVAAPRATWTWNDYLDVARRLVKKDAAGTATQTGVMVPGFGATDTHALMWLWSNGGELFSPDFKQVRVADDASVEAMQFVVDLVRKQGVASSSPGVPDFGTNPPYVSGKIGMWRANRGAYGFLRDVSGFKVNVVPIPRAPRTNAAVTVTTPGQIGIASSNKNRDAAWEWLTFLTGTEAQTIRSRVHGAGCPSRKSAALDKTYTEIGPPALETLAANKTFADAMTDTKGVRFVPNYIAMTEALGIFNKHAGAAAKGEIAVPAAMGSARRELEDLLQRRPQPQ